MTTLTLRYIKGDFVVTGPDIESARFKTRREAKDWCVAHYPGSPIKEIGPIYKPPSAERRAVKRGLKGAHRAPHQFARALRVEPEETPAVRRKAEEDLGR